MPKSYDVWSRSDDHFIIIGAEASLIRVYVNTGLLPNPDTPVFEFDSDNDTYDIVM